MRSLGLATQTLLDRQNSITSCSAQPKALRIAACISPTNAPRPDFSSMSSSTKIRGAGVSRMRVQRSPRSRKKAPATGGSPLLRRPVTAYPTKGGASANMHQPLPLVNPVLRVLTVNFSMAFAIMQVSNWRRASSSSSVNNDAVAIRIVLSVGYQRSFTSSVSAHCPYFLAISVRTLLLDDGCGHWLWSCNLASVCRVSSHVVAVATTLPSHHEIDLRNPEVFLNFRVLRENPATRLITTSSLLIEIRKKKRMQ